MSKTVLFIDDSATQRSVMTTALKEAGYNCLEAGDGLEGISVLQAQGDAKIHLIICDVNMPNMNGLDFVRHIKNEDQWKLIPVVMLTTEAGETMKKQGLEIGVRAWAVKPCPPEKLLKAVDKLLA